VPKDCDCTVVGEFCGVHVWVLPGRRAELAKLTLAILDYALNSAPVPLTKTVTYYLDEQGLPTTSAKAVSTVVGTVNVNESNFSLLNEGNSTDLALKDKLQHQLFDLEQQLASFPQGADLEKANREDIRRRNDLLAQRDRMLAQLRYLDMQLSAGGLKQGYTRTMVIQPGTTNAILSTQTLNTLTAPATLSAP
jgi:hypothetical protein